MSNLLDIFDYDVKKFTEMPKLYDVFLSHKQAEAQDRAKIYKLLFKQHGIKAFYDKDELTDDDWTYEKLIEVVSRSKCLFFLFTPTILENLWCQLELLIAIKSKMPIYIINIEPTWPNKHLSITKSMFPIYLQPALSNNIIMDHRYDFNKLEKQLVGIVKSIIKKPLTKKKKQKLN
jgi:hypothetical protein